MDAIDAVLVRIDDHRLALRPTFLEQRSQSILDLAPALRALTTEPRSASEVARLARELGDRHAALIEQFNTPPDLVVLHGQTIHHDPPDSWQLMNPHPVAHAVRCPVMYDLRGPDLAAGGQGAPITPLADFIMFRHPERTRAVVNLGGFCNLTILDPWHDDTPHDIDVATLPLHGRDVCVCNQLLDAVARRALGTPFDDNGTHAASGTIDDPRMNELLDLLTTQRDEQRSLGTGDEVGEWLNAHADSLSPDDLAATTASAVATCIGMTTREEHPDEILLAGGGVHHHLLVRTIAETSGISVQLSDTCGVPTQAREAMAMAILGALAMDGVPITLPQVTGRTGQTTTPPIIPPSEPQA